MYMMIVIMWFSGNPIVETLGDFVGKPRCEAARDELLNQAKILDIDNKILAFCASRTD
jgi:hypothetical protein